MILINLGCGTHAPLGWVNFDRSPNLVLDRLPLAKVALHRLGVLSEDHLSPWPKNVRFADLTRGIPLAGSSVDGAYSSHALEHLYLEDARLLIIECLRVLRPNAILRLALPDVDHLIAEKARAAMSGTIFNEMLGMHPTSRPRGIKKFTNMAAGNLHKWQPTRDLVISILAAAGFSDVIERRWLEGELPQLLDVETRRESFFLEARA